jgi:folate-binding protein YgfZ
MFHVKHAYHHTNRRVIAIAGEDRSTFLQGLITNDINLLSEKGMIYAAMLTPQGKFLYDFFLTSQDDKILLDCLDEIHAPLMKKLMLYRLRARVAIEDVSEFYGVYSVHDEEANLTLDPRCPQLGYRAIIKKEDLPFSNNLDDYDKLRLSLGIPEILKDMIPEKSIPLECNLDQLNAISWSKGCYVGQELTARTHYRGVVRKRLLPVKISGKQPAELIFQGDQEVGKLYSHNQEVGIARLRIDDIQDALIGEKLLTCGDAQLKPFVPEWMALEK